MFRLRLSGGLARGALALFFSTWAALAATLVIDCGSPADRYFSGGAPFAIIAPVPDTTLRFGTVFSYQIPAENVPYVVTFRFVEPCGAAGGCSMAPITAPGQRVFTITANDMPILPDLDIFAMVGALVPVSRSVLVMGSDKLLRFSFLSRVRTAIISSIEVQPLVEFIGATAVSATARELLWAEYVADRQPDGSYLYASPAAPINAIRTGPIVFRKGTPQTLVFDYKLDPANPLRIVPLAPWDAADVVLVEYTFLINGGPVVSSPAAFFIQSVLPLAVQ